MKKNSIYFIAPAAGLILFGAIYWNFAAGYEKHQAVIAAKVKADKDAKLEKEAADKKKAYDDALAAVERRKKEKEEKDKREQQKIDARMAMESEREKTQAESHKLDDKERALAKDLDAVKKEITEIEEKKKQEQQEEVFLRDSVKLAESNRQQYAAILQKIQDADKAADDAAKEAAKKKQ